MMEEQEQSVERTCHICNNKLSIYSHPLTIYCSDECKNIGRKIRDKVIRDKKKMHIKPRTCKRCHRIFTPIEGSSRRYCKYCIAINTKGEEYHKCMDCGIKINILKKRCYKCAKKVKYIRIKKRKEVLKERTVEVKNDAKIKGVTKKEPKINSKWTKPRGSKNVKKWEKENK